jgi:hypothetical protein
MIFIPTHFDTPYAPDINPPWSRFFHPADRQVQADLVGSGVGAPCPSVASLHNRSATVRPPAYIIMSSHGSLRRSN